MRNNLSKKEQALVLLDKEQARFKHNPKVRNALLQIAAVLRKCSNRKAIEVLDFLLYFLGERRRDHVNGGKEHGNLK